MNHLSSFSDPLILLLCSFHTVLNWITASFFTISSYSWPSLYQVWKHYHCLRFRDAAVYCITSQSVQKHFDVILLLDIEEQLPTWRMVFHFEVTVSRNTTRLLHSIYPLISLYFFLSVSRPNKVNPQFMSSNVFINLGRKKTEKCSNVRLFTVVWQKYLVGYH